MNLVLGLGKSGKSKYIFDEIDDNIKNKKDVIYFVPSQMRVLSEENYMDFQNKSGIIGINFTTISSYIKDFLSEYKLDEDDKYISKIDRKIILTKIIIDNPDIFSVFNKVKNKDGFLDSLDIYMDIFKKEEVSIENIEKIQIKDKLLEFKLKEIANVYSKYISYTKDIFVDSVDENNIFLKLFEEKFTGKDLSDIKIYFDSYNNFTNQEFKFIKLLFKLGFDLTFGITTDIASKCEDITNINKISNILLSENENIYTIPNNTLITLIKYANKFNQKVNTEFLNCNYSKAPEDIKFLSNNLFVDTNFPKIKSENVNINLYSNLYEEVKNICIDISKKIHDGYRYSDFVIYTTNTNEYEYVINKTFYEYNIPVYIDTKISIESNILIKYILKFLEICKYGYRRDNVFEILKYGLNNVTFEEISYLENYSLEFNIDKYKFEKSFIYNNTNLNEAYDINKLNEIRIKILNSFDECRVYFNSLHSAKDIIQKLYDTLIFSEVLNNYESVISEMKNSVDPSIKYIGNAGYQMWENICSIFNSITKIYLDDKIKIEDFYKIFKYLLKDISIKGIPPTIDEVQVLDINNSKSSPKEAIFFIGVNEDKFPKKIEDDILFSDTELEKLNTLNIDFKETSLSKTNMQLYNISEHLKEAYEKLYISFVSSDTSGKSLRPSYIIDSISELLDIEIIGSVTTSSEKIDVYSKKAIFERLMNLINSCEQITDEMLVLYKYISENEYFDEIMEYSRLEDKLNENTIKKITGEKFTTSVSKLELFKKCPFSYFLKYGLKLNKRNIFDITSLDIGSFMHKVLESFSLYLFSNKISWQEILLEKEKFSSILDNIIEVELNNSFVKHKENIKYVILKQKLKNTMNKVIFTVAQGFNQSRFVPYGYEIEFKDGALFAPIEITLDNGSIMYIIGKIDRIDTMILNDIIYARIVDYKSSSKDLKLSDIREGLSLQLLTYLSSFISNIKENKVLPAGMMYFTLSEKLVNLKNYTDDDKKISKSVIESLRMKGIFLKDVQVLNLMDSKLNEDDRLIDVSSRTVNSEKKSDRLLEKDEFNTLCSDVKLILKNIASDILSGNVSISPNKKANHCKYCEFDSVCRKNNMC